MKNYSQLFPKEDNCFFNCFTITLQEKLYSQGICWIDFWWVWSFLVFTLRCLSGWEGPCYTKIISYSSELQGCSLSLSCTLQPCFLLEVQSPFSLQVWFLCAVLQSRPWHQLMCTYCRSHALTSLKGKFLCIMLCSMLCRCLFIYDEGPVFLFLIFFYMFIIGRYVGRFSRMWSISMFGQST